MTMPDGKGGGAVLDRPRTVRIRSDARMASPAERRESRASIMWWTLPDCPSGPTAASRSE